MGGLLVAEIALSVSEHRSEANSRYRIIGTINLDTPFLGMHPGIVVSGLSSLFRPTPEHSDSQELSSQVQQLGLKPSLEASSLLAPEASSTSLISSASTLHLSPSTPSINPDSSNAFQSDQRPAKQSTWEKAFYFLNKHSGDLTKATRAYFTSHLEFGGCLADPKGLMSRYSRIIALDEQGTGYKVHFVNYYTASTGRPKKPKTPKVEEKGAKPRSPENEIERLEREARSLEGGAVDESSNRYPRKSSEDDQSQILTSAEEALQEASGPDLIPSGGEGTLGISDPPPASISLQTTQSSSANESSTMKPLSSPTHSADDLLPPLPSKPTEPPPFDPTSYKDKDILKIATRDHARLTKAYQRALKDRDKAIADRRKMLVKRAKDEERRSKTEAKKMKKSVDGAAVGGRDAVDMDETGPLACPIPGRASSSSSSLQPNAPSHPPPPLPPAATAPQSTAAQTSPILHHSPQNPSHNQPQQKPHTFCLLPPKRPSADLDPHWIRIFMPGVDEVGAHCGLFDQGGAHYEGLVGDLVGRVEGWVGER
ncbi:MAG: hypothetical protein LQ350_001332 [Teloschistes chrysophthalmus]|nr:MAG: hypothetical protein LQ350_001332 [Niorma chrysophthalma]